jgi:hypothetical protein
MGPRQLLSRCSVGKLLACNIVCAAAAAAAAAAAVAAAAAGKNDA